ncbi:MULTISPECIES: hypothetical protein [Mesorhizobium]|uniref:hypothetical protein n=1 Tax=Mesorhizobium TaxID=68287 RepID=UPI0010A9739E|nr:MULTISPECIES: hypothetical protein [Mesorhizobium]
MTYVGVLVFLHTLVSLVAIVAGIIAIIEMFGGKRSSFATDFFLQTAGFTSITGFLFPFHGVTPAVIVGIVALVILAGVLVARSRFHFAGAWRGIYAAGMTASVYLLVFVGIVQAFQKIPILNVFAPTGTEIPFVVTQGVTLLIFLVVGALAVLRYKPAVALS